MLNFSYLFFFKFIFSSEEDKCVCANRIESISDSAIKYERFIKVKIENDDHDGASLGIYK